MTGEEARNLLLVAERRNAMLAKALSDVLVRYVNLMKSRGLDVVRDGDPLLLSANAALLAARDS